MIAYLIRHGAAAHLSGGWLAGRRPGVPLDAEGREQAARLAEAFASIPLQAIYSSPLDRALATASPLAAAQSLPVAIRPGLTDVDFGQWTGKTFTELSDDPGWRTFNADREHACAPGGECLRQVRDRAVHELTTISATVSGPVAVITHAEVIRSFIAWATGASLDVVQTAAIDPCGVTVVECDVHTARVLHLNTSAASLQHVFVPGWSPRRG